MPPHPDKPLLRKHFLAARRRIPPKDAARASEQAALQAIDLIGEDFQSVAGYFPLQGEISPLPLLAALAARGLHTALPCLNAPHTALMFRAWKQGDALQPAPHGTREPMPQAAEIHPQIIIVPMLAFDRAGHRLGYGGGYYDRTLAALRAKGALKMAIGLAFSGQETEALPVGEHDARLDAVVTEREAMLFQVAA